MCTKKPWRRLILLHNRSVMRSLHDVWAFFFNRIWAQWFKILSEFHNLLTVVRRPKLYGQPFIFVLFGKIKGQGRGVFGLFFFPCSQSVLIMFPWGSQRSQYVPQDAPNKTSHLSHMVFFCPKVQLFVYVNWI
jgi:hypothetical protein